MTPERWQRVKELFSAVSSLAEAERAAYLSAACADDPELRAEVDSLLAAHDTADAIVDRSAAEMAGGIESGLAAPTPDPWLGRQIGAYEITALLGHGGMGRVYRARRVDAEYEKEVAIKLVPGGYQAAYVLERLRAERQILANLEHPNIARLIDGGATDDGSPYLVMELVEGEPLDRYAERHALSTRERLRLFRDVCAAVSYAHQRLVVHRDLKPGNILVTADGSVRLLDFGIAKLLDPAAAEAGAAPTVTLMHALTPGFASPEQILGRPVTTASDVYSLGVVLYLLLTGKSPYRSALDSAQDAIREVCETEPARPSAVVEAGMQRRERLDRDLDAIVLRALRKEPESRYASVEQLSEDLRRYLDGLPVRARGDRWSYRTRKFLRRRKLELGAAALVVLALAGATAVSVRQARVAEREQQRAERHFQSVRNLADTFLFDVHDAIEDLPGSTRARELLVSTALKYLNTLAAEAADDRELAQELASAYEKVASIQGQAYAANTGEPRAALESYGKAVALLEAVVATKTGNGRARAALANDYARESELLLMLGDTASAAARSEKAIAMLEPLAAESPDARRTLAAAYRSHAYTLAMTGGDDAVGADFAHKGVAILEDLARASPDDLELAHDLGSAYGSWAIAVMRGQPRSGAVEEALAIHRKALEVDERLVAATQGRNATYLRGVLVDRLNIALALIELQDYRGAVENARAAQPARAALAVDADNAQARLDDANLAWPLARALVAAGELDEAAAIFERSRATLEALAREGDTLKIQYLLGGAAYGLGEVHSRRASDAGSPRAARLEHWRLAKDWYDKALPHFERVTASVKLDFSDQRPIDEAMRGLSRAVAEIAALEAETPIR